jgi:glycosyltransferase involved in cell wall biosynthesis
MPSIACVVPTLNSASTLEDTLLSLRKQSGVDVEIIVADSGSVDESREIAARWGAQVIFEPPGNMYRAINAALAATDHEFSTYLNSDDTVYADAYKTLIATLGSASIAYGDCDFVDWEGRFLGSFRAARPHELGPIGRTGLLALMQPASLFRTAAWRELGGFDSTFRFAADAHFFYRALCAGYGFAYCEKPIASFRIHDAQLSSKRIAEIREEERRMRPILGSPRLVHDWLARASWKRRNLGNYLVRLTRRRLVQGELRLARSGEP